MPNTEDVFRTEIQCDNCLTWFRVLFSDPSETFEGTCPECGAHYPQLYV